MIIAKNRLDFRVGFMIAEDQYQKPTFVESIAGTYVGVVKAKGAFYSNGCTYVANVVKNRKRKIPVKRRLCHISDAGIAYEDWTSIERGTQLFFVVENDKMKIYAAV